MGAEVAAQALAEAVSRQSLLNGDPQAFITEAGATSPYKGDLTNFLPLDPLFSNLLPSPDNLQQRSTRPVEAEGEAGDALFAETQIPVALVGTSYSANPHWNFLGALQQALRSDVANYAEDGHGPCCQCSSTCRATPSRTLPASGGVGIPRTLSANEERPQRLRSDLDRPAEEHPQDRRKPGPVVQSDGSLKRTST